MKKLLTLGMAAMMIAGGSTVFAATSPTEKGEKPLKSKTEHFEAIKAKAESLGMTVEELKANMIEQKK